MKKIETVEGARKQAELMQEKFYQFCVRALDKFASVSTANPTEINRVKHAKIYGKNQIREAFEAVHSVIMRELQQAQMEDIEGVLFDIEDEPFDEEVQSEAFIKRNVRVKPRIRGRQVERDNNSSTGGFSRESSINSKSSHANSLIESEHSDTASKTRHLYINTRFINLE